MNFVGRKQTRAVGFHTGGARERNLAQRQFG
jgi:hypothetical protein